METPAKLERVRTQLGFDLLMDPADYLSVLLIRDGVFEVPETDLVTRILRPGDTCIDAGCHLGYYSCLAACLVEGTGRVFAFDANPAACESARRNLALNGLCSCEVIQVAVSEREGDRTFYLSTNDQTGLSSLGPIPLQKETISVPSLRLGNFINERGLDRIRLLKLDVEGAEEIALKGLGNCLEAHIIDFILAECYDERLHLLNSSAEVIGNLLSSAGYSAWEFGTGIPAGWSRANKVRSRGDCSYLFSSPLIADLPPSITLSAALNWANVQREQLRIEKDAQLSSRTAQSAVEIAALKEEVETWREIQKSAGWRLLNKWRRMRDRLAPESSRRRALYDSILRAFRGR
jgi:FkbM family methyltransferase